MWEVSQTWVSKQSFLLTPVADNRYGVKRPLPIDVNVIIGHTQLALQLVVVLAGKCELLHSELPSVAS